VNEETRSWSVGALARAAGVTVRTLRHYDEIGLLSASARSQGEHRRYSTRDVQRLYRILALRSLGFGLDAIASFLAGDHQRPLVEIVREQRDRVDLDLDHSRRLRRRLDDILTTVTAASEPSADDLLEIMEMLTMTEISPSLVTTLLRRGGRLPTGAVTRVDYHDLPSQSSQIARLRLYYDRDAPTGAPRSMILKRNLSVAWAVQASADEVRFYRTVGGLPDHPRLVPECYAPLHEALTGESHLLLEDLSATHVPATSDRDAQVAGDVPDDDTIEAVVDTLARIHAYWWDHRLLRDGIFPLLDWNGDTTRYGEYQQHRRRSWQALSARAAAEIPPDMHELLEDVFARLPAHWDRHMADRVRDRRHLTLMHGNSYFVNFLVPLPGTRGDTYLIDWQCPTANIGAHDLVNLCATFWTREQRRHGDREERILRHYHRRLTDHGVVDYDFDQLRDDYRSGLIYWLLVPIQDAYGGAPRDYWWPKLRCLVEAYHDWNAGELLNPDGHQPDTRPGNGAAPTH